MNKDGSLSAKAIALPVVLLVPPNSIPERWKGALLAYQDEKLIANVIEPSPWQNSTEKKDETPGYSGLRQDWEVLSNRPPK